MYHYIGDAAPHDPHRGLFVPASEFRGHLAQITGMGLRAVSPPEYANGLGTAALRRTVWLTFDDGKLDNYTAAFPLLVEAGHRATFFLVVDAVLRGEAGYMTLAQAREMAAAGMDFGSHTLSHARVARLDEKAARAEIIDSKHKLEDALGIEITSFCYPYGNWNARTVDIVREAGYRCATSTIRDNRNSEADRWTLRRAMVQPGRVGRRFRYTFSPLYHWVHALKNARRWRPR